MIILFNNDASSTLQSGINSLATTAMLAAGSGALFPAIGAGQGFFLTFLDAPTQQTKEIVLCTARTGDTLTIVRAQQGTTAETWNAGDIASQLVTAGDAEQMIQPDQLQSATYTSAIAGGSANSLTATLDSGLTALPNLLAFTLEASAANTGAVTLTLTLGTTVISAQPIHKFGGSSLNANDIPAAGYPMELIWSATLGAFILINPGTGTAGSIAGGLANEILYQSAPGTTAFINAPTADGEVLSRAGGVLAWLAAAVTSFAGRSGAVTPEAGDYDSADVGAVSVASVTGANQSLIAASGYQYLAGDPTQPRTILNWGFAQINTNNVPVTLAKSYPNAVGIVILISTDGSTGVRSPPSTWTKTGFTAIGNGGSVGSVVWISIGW